MLHHSQLSQTSKQSVGIDLAVSVAPGINRLQLHDGLTSSGGGLRLFPLRGKAFDALSSIFVTFLNYCMGAKDFLAAHRLLEVSGTFYRLVRLHRTNPEADGDLVSAEETPNRPLTTSDDGEDDEMSSVIEETLDVSHHDRSIEFLSAKIMHHPMYQGLYLWKVLTCLYQPILEPLRSRISIVNLDKN